MQRRHKTMLVAFQLVALQLVVALACAAAAPRVGTRASRAYGSTAHGATASYPRTSTRPSAQRRGRGRRLRRADALTAGTWGGQHIRIEVTDDGARIDLDCAHASVEGKIYVDRSGRFSAAATYYHEHGGPVRESEEARGERVTLTGNVGGSLMKLTIARGKTQLGAYTLTRDGEGRVVKCR